MPHILAPIGLAVLVAAAPPHRAATPPPHRAAPAAGNLVSLIGSDDYPNAALRNEEQGTVTVALAVDPKGAVSSCTVTASSGSDSLDTTTCRVMIERAHFTPAHDRRGRPVADIYSQTITWRIQGDSAPSPVLEAYVKCVVTAAQRLAAGPGTDKAVAEAAFSACPGEERAMLPPASPQPPENVARLRGGLRPALLQAIHARRTPH